MITRLAGSLLRQSPRLRRVVWVGAYRYLSARYVGQDWTFTNYGLAMGDRDPDRPHVHPEDEPDRLSIQLYDRVASGKLRGLDVLEISCGRGGGASYMARCLQPRFTVGLDAAPGMIAFCRLRHRLPGLSFCVGDAEALPFGNETFTAVVNVEAAHCYGSVPRFLSQVHRVLQPDGWLLFADMHDRRDVSGVRAALRAAGFTTVEEEDITPGVVRALEEKSDRTEEWISSNVPRPLRGALAAFAGVRNTARHRTLRGGETAYLRFSARKH